MSFLIYLDQNSLSDLRQRRIEDSKNEELRLLKHALKSEQVKIVYSHITLDEIFQIPKREYQQEHIDTLTELNAKYIEPLSRKLSHLTPENIWRAHIENKQSNIELGITSLIGTGQLFFRKISGLKIEESFSEINTKFKESLDELISKSESQLASIDFDTLSEAEKEFFLNIRSKMDETRAKIPSLKAPEVDSGQPLGPKLFRELSEIKSLEIQSLDANHVVRAIESIFNLENSNFKLSDYFDETPQTDVARAYSLINWAGYYADDFTKAKKGKDRFNASNNDMQHAVAACGVNFLISNDIKFCKKAAACFAYINSSTIVCSPKEFIENHCKFV